MSRNTSWTSLKRNKGRCTRRYSQIFMTLKFVCAHALYTHPWHFVSADVCAIRRKSLALTTNTLANTKLSRGQLYNKLEIDINLSFLTSRARSTWCYTEYNVIYLPSKPIFLYRVVKSNKCEGNSKFWLE